MEKELFNNKNSIFLIFNWKMKKAYDKMFYPIIRELELTQSEADILLFLYNNKQFDTAGDIAKYRAMSKSMISKSVDGLYQKAFIAYQVDQKDKRCIHLTLEETAMPIVQQLKKVQKDFFDQLTHGITEHEYRVIESALDKMYINITQTLK